MYWSSTFYKDSKKQKQGFVKTDASDLVIMDVWDEIYGFDFSTQLDMGQKKF